MTRDLQHTRTSDIHALREEWRDLMLRIRDPRFPQRWEWHCAAREHLVSGVTYHAFRLHGRLVAVVPLAPAGRGIQELPRHRELFLSDLPWDEDILGDAATGVSAAEVLRAAGESADVVHLRGLAHRSALMQALGPPARGIRAVRLEGQTFVPIAGPEPLSVLSDKHLRNVARLRRRAETQVGQVERYSYTGPDAAGTGLGRFVEVESSGWKGAEGEGTSLDCLRDEQAFYGSVLAAFGEAGDARVEVLELGGSPAAALVALHTGGVWNVLKVAFVEAFAEFGPGNILLREFLDEMALDDGVREVSLVTAPSWARRWHMSWEPTYHVKVFRKSLRGSLLKGRHDIVAALGRTGLRLRSASTE